MSDLIADLETAWRNTSCDKDARVMRLAKVRIQSLEADLAHWKANHASVARLKKDQERRKSEWRLRALKAEADLERAKEALRPFGDASSRLHSGYDVGIDAGDHPMVRVFVTDIRQAAQALSDMEGK